MGEKSAIKGPYLVEIAILIAIVQGPRHGPGQTKDSTHRALQYLVSLYQQEHYGKNPCGLGLRGKSYLIWSFFIFSSSRSEKSEDTESERIIWIGTLLREKT